MPLGKRSSSRRRSPWWRRRRDLVGAVLSLVALTACSDTDPPSAPGTLPSVESMAPSSSGPVISSATGTPSRPSDADAETLAGAAAFTRYYFTVVNAAFDARTGAFLKPLSAGASCASCTKFEEGAEAMATRDQELRGGDYSVVSAEASSQERDRVVVHVVYAVSPYTINDAGGAAVLRGDGLANVAGQVLCVRTGDGWRIGELRTSDPHS